jgi:glutathione S-transferase
MKLYYHPVSTTSRPIMMFAADSGITLDYQLVDLFAGAHMQPDFAAINPSQQVPVLDDDGFVLTECSAILKYLAEKTGSPAYPSDLRQRARVNERMDWLNTGLARDLLYGFCYPQSMAHHKRQDDATHAAGSASSTSRSSAPTTPTCAATASRWPTTWAPQFCRTARWSNSTTRTGATSAAGSPR